MNRSKLEYLLQDHHKDAFLWARHCCRYDSDDAHEVLQKTYLKVLEGKAVYSEQSSFKTWLFSVIRFTALDHLKSKPIICDPGINGESVELPFETETINYRKLMARLSDRQHQVLLLAFYHGMTLTEIAEVTRLHIGTVRTHYERGKNALKQLIVKEHA